MEHIAMDQAEEEYWNTSDDEEDMQGRMDSRGSAINGESSRKLVDYASDEDPDDNVEAGALSADEDRVDSESTDESVTKSNASSPSGGVPPPERLSEKRRREEDEEEDLGKMIQSKRRNSMSANSNAAPSPSLLRKKKGAAGAKDGGGPRKIAISLPSNAKVGTENAANQPDEV